MQRRLICFVFMSLPWSLSAQTGHMKPIEIKGHFIGESIAELLSKEPKVQQQVKSCEQRPTKPTCDLVLAAVEHRGRAGVANSSWMNFVVDGGHLVKLTTLVNENSDAVSDLTKKFGPRSSETTFPMRNALGTTWKDHLSVWDTPTVYATLREDNNPASQNHHYVLSVESRAEHDRECAEEATQSALQDREVKRSDRQIFATLSWETASLLNGSKPASGKCLITPTPESIWTHGETGHMEY